MSRRLPLLKLVILACLFHFSSTFVNAEVVDVETSFGDRGRAIVDNPVRDADAFIPIQIENAPGGGYVFASNTRNNQGFQDYFLCRVTAQGALDTQFGNKNGCAQIGGDANDILSSFIVTRSNKYLLVGYTWSYGAIRENIYLVMLNSNGSLDTSFGTNGQLIIGTSEQQLGYTAIEAETGSFIIVGTSREGSTGGSKDVYVTKINSSGSVDTSFGSSGYLMFGGWSDEDPRTIVKASDGNYVIGGYEGWVNQNRNFYLAKISTTGALVSSFGTNGQVHIDIAEDEYGENIILLSDGNLLLQGTGELSGVRYGYLLKINNNGGLVSNFGNGGHIRFPLGITITDVALDSAGRIIVSGSQTVGSVSSLLVYRYNVNGSPDTTFRNGNHSIVYANPVNTSRSIFGNSLIYDATTRSIITAGNFVNINGSTDAILVKFQIGFQVSGLASAIDVQSDQKSIKSGSAHGVVGTSDFVLFNNGLMVVKGVLSLSSDVNWSTMQLEQSLSNYKMLFRPGNLSGYDTIKNLYLVKHHSHNFFVVCPSATSSNQISKGCAGEQIYHKNSRAISTFIYGGKTYWELPVSMKNIGAMSYYEDDSTVPVTITQMHKFTELPDYKEINFYSTSRLIYVKGTAEPNAIITFRSPEQRFQSATDSNGVFELILEIRSKASNIVLDYYATSKLDVNSPFKTIYLHIGCDTFPEDLYQTYCQNPKDPGSYHRDSYISIIRDNSDVTKQQVLEEEKEEYENDPIYRDYINENRSFERVTTKKIVIELSYYNGKLYSQKEVWVDDIKYTTDENGRIVLEIDKDEESVLLRLADGTAVRSDLGDASFARVYIDSNFNNMNLLIVLIVIPSVILTITILLFFSIRRRSKLRKAKQEVDTIAKQG